VLTWLNCNKLTLNVKKTQAMKFMVTNSEININLTFNNEPITFTDDLNLLGIHFDTKLTFASHINGIRSKISSAIGIIQRNKHFLTQNLRRQLYFSLIHPHLLYGIELWGGAAQKHLKPLQNLQKRALRVVAGAKPRTTTTPLFKNAKILKLTDIYELQIAKLMFSGFHNTLPPNIQRQINKTQQNRSTRQTHLNLYIKQRSTKIQNLRPSVEGPYLWNGLSNTIRESKNIHIFKHKFTKQNFLYYTE